MRGRRRPRGRKSCGDTSEQHSAWYCLGDGQERHQACGDPLAVPMNAPRACCKCGACCRLIDVAIQEGHLSLVQTLHAAGASSSLHLEIRHGMLCWLMCLRDLCCCVMYIAVLKPFILHLGEASQNPTAMAGGGMAEMLGPDTRKVKNVIAAWSIHLAIADIKLVTLLQASLQDTASRSRLLRRLAHCSVAG